MISAEPMISLQAFIIGSIAILIMARAVIELKARKMRQHQTGERKASVSQQAIQRYYNQKGA